jgi:hypothetical protein
MCICLDKILLVLFQYIQIYGVVMTEFTKSLKLLINLSKVFGLISFCSTFNTGLLNRDTNSTYRIFLELIRTFFFVVSTCRIIFHLNTYYSIHFTIMKYWFIIITARIMENFIIKYEFLHYLFYI